MSVTSDPPDGPQRGAGAVLARIGLFLLVSVLAGTLAAAAALPFVGSAGIGARTAVEDFEALPAQLTKAPLPQQSTILAADGSVLARIFYQNRIEVPLARVAPVMQQAIVAIEDSRFYDHRGIDLRGTMRAFVSTTGGGDVQGGSTITQQYVKNVLVTTASNEEEAADARSRTITRKIRELRYALALEKQLTKDQILERYLNIAYFGAGAYGVEAAARRYFSTNAASLSLSQAALLAGIVQQPVGFDPTRHPRAAQIRRDVVLKRMAELTIITQAQAKAAMKKSVKSMLKPRQVPNGCTTSWAPFFCDYVVRVIRNDPAFGSTRAAREALLRAGGLTITTTLDRPTQTSAMAAVMDAIPRKDPSGKAAALSMVRPGTGEIIAMAQNRAWGIKGKGFTTYNYNVDAAHGGTIGMQAGSTFKVFTLAAALEKGISGYDTIESPPEKTWTDFKSCDGKNVSFPPYRARNSTGSGSFNMYSGTAFSVNTYFLELEYRTGICRPVQIAQQMGVRKALGDPLDAVPSQVLGTNEVTPLAMAGAYAGFANHGVFCKPIAISRVVDRNGNSLRVPDAGCKQVVSRDVADAVTSMLAGVIDGPLGGRTGAQMTLGRPAAGKTGTTNTSAAVWFAGYTPDLAAAVWCGDPRGGFGHPMKDVVINGEYYDQVFGSSLPGPIWKAAMTAALATTLPVPWDLRPAQGLDPQGGPRDPNATPKPSPSGSPSPSASGSPTASPSAPAPKPTSTPKPTATSKPSPSPKPTSTSSPSA